jgi:hypothetical protein
LRRSGFEVLSVASESQARFEIEMGRCGILLICFRAHPETIHELSTLLKRSCPAGRIIFVMNETQKKAPRAVDLIVPESDGAKGIIEAVKSVTDTPFRQTS